MDKRRHPPKPVVDKVSSDLNISRKNVKAIKKSPSIVQSESSGYSQLAGDVDRWIHGSGTNVSNRVVPARNVSLTSRGIQGSRHQPPQRRSTTTSGMHLHSGPCYTLAMMLLSIENQGGPRFLATILSCVKFLASQVKQACVDCVLDLRRALQFNNLYTSIDVFATYVFAAAMDALFVVYAFGFLAISLYQMSMGSV